MVSILFVNFCWDWAQCVVKGMAEVFVDTNYTPFVAIHDWDLARARRELTSCIQRHDEGVIMQPLQGLTDLYEKLTDVGIPLVFLGDYPADMPRSSFVAWDSKPDVLLALRHLVDIGRRRIAYLGYDYPMPINRERLATFSAFVEEAGLPKEANWTAISPFEWSPDQIMNWSVDRLFGPGQPRPEAILVQNDGLAVPLLDKLARSGIRVPEEVVVVGMGDYPITAHADINLTTTVEPLQAMGVEAAKAIVGLIAQPESAPIQKLVPGGLLRVRRTTAVPGNAPTP